MGPHPNPPPRLAIDFSCAKSNETFKVAATGEVSIAFPGKKARGFVRFISDFKKESDILWFDQMLLLLAALCHVRSPFPPCRHNSCHPFTSYVVQGSNPKVALAVAGVLSAESILALVQLEEVPTKIRSRLLHAFARIYAPFYVDLEAVNDDVQALSQAAQLLAEVLQIVISQTPFPKTLNILVS